MKTKWIIGCALVGAVLGLTTSLAYADKLSDYWADSDTKSEADMRELMRVCIPGKYDAFVAQSKAWIVWRTSTTFAPQVNAQVVAATPAARHKIKPEDARPDSPLCKENIPSLNGLETLRSAAMKQ
ncbi:hypothetical protein [Burkholderia sp. 22PA0106]|uniref:hypothetical protein n=1 Tax=Burkholderia sp. 22PA0106 TaxID=3237371 RepID=UPI0039C00BED